MVKLNANDSLELVEVDFSRPVLFFRRGSDATDRFGLLKGQSSCKYFGLGIRGEGAALISSEGDSSKICPLRMSQSQSQSQRCFREGHSIFYLHLSAV